MCVRRATGRVCETSASMVACVHLRRHADRDLQSAPALACGRCTVAACNASLSCDSFYRFDKQLHHSRAPVLPELCSQPLGMSRNNIRPIVYLCVYC